MKYIFEARYCYERNTISFSKPFKVTEEVDTYYYCGEIGEKYLKKRENDVRIVNSPCQVNAVLWRTGIVSEDFVEENTLMFKLYYEDIKREMVETLKDYLKAQIEEIEVC